MYRICLVMQEYSREMEEEGIRDNFVICYELMDKLIDFGYPDAEVLQEYIIQVINAIAHVSKELIYSLL